VDARAIRSSEKRAHYDEKMECQRKISFSLSCLNQLFFQEEDCSSYGFSKVAVILQEINLFLSTENIECLTHRFDTLILRKNSLLRAKKNYCSLKTWRISVF